MSKTRVYIWKPGKPDDNSWFHGRSGHSSMEIEDSDGKRSYHSFWPEKSRDEKTINSVVTLKESACSNSYEEDVKRMGYPADKVVDVNGLNAKAMRKYWEEEA